MRNEIRDRVTDKMDVRVISLIIFMTVVEFEVFTFSRSVIKVSEQDSWISILIGAGMLSLNAYILSLLAARFPQKNFFEYCPQIWGKTAGFLIQLAYLFYWFATLSIIFEDFSVANETLFLPKTPNIVPIALLAIGAFWIVSYGFVALTRFYQLMLLFFLIPLLTVVLLGLGHIHLHYFKPFLGHNIGTLIKGGLQFAGIYQGLEIILFAGPFLTEPKKMMKPALIGVIMGTVFPFVLSILAIGSLGVENLKQSVWSGIDTMSMIALPGFPVERYELFLTMPWLIALFTTICGFLYLLAYGMKEMFHLKDRKRVIGLLVSVAALAIYLFPNYAWAMKFRSILAMVTFLFIAILPLFTLILAILRGEGDIQ